MSPTKLSLDGKYDVIYKLFPPRESLVSDIQAGNIEKLFLQCSRLWMGDENCGEGGARGQAPPSSNGSLSETQMRWGIKHAYLIRLYLIHKSARSHPPSARSHPPSARSHPLLDRSHPQPRLDLIHHRLDLIHNLG
jgi:hypothetical protein